jgi:membrane-associated phospholipid phosphatase
MTLINLQASALTGVLTRSIDRLVVRQRPDVEPCREDPGYHDMCFRGPNSAFPSGHTSGAFTGAGLVCAHHLELSLYGHVVADVAACGVNAAMALAVGMLRVHADRHYVLDVVTGALIGTTTGFAVPLIGHYWFVEVPHGGNLVSRWSIAPLAGDTWGATLLGSL